MAFLDYSGAIKITFNRAIINDPEIVTGTEVYKPFYLPEVNAPPTSSGDNASYPKANAFDGSTANYWRSSSATAPQWIGKDFGGAVTLDKVRVNMSYVAGRINGYEVQGSNDNSIWNVVASGNFANDSDWKDVTFAPVAYRYWRLVGLSRHSSYYSVSELEFCITRNTYNVAGWTVVSTENLYAPEGAVIQRTIPVRKVTKSADNLSITLWFDLPNRMKASDLITVTYAKAVGNLMGAGDKQVESFVMPFAPVNLTVVENPGDTERITALTAFNVTVSEIAYRDFKAPHEYITAQASMTVVVTKVGDLPL